MGLQTVETKGIKDLLSAYGYEFESEDLQQRRTRFRSETGFIDLWKGMFGITMCMYDPRTKKLKYRKKCTISDIENMINSI